MTNCATAKQAFVTRVDKTGIWPHPLILLGAMRNWRYEMAMLDLSLQTDLDGAQPNHGSRP